MAKVIITGGTGLIGSMLTKLLLARKDEVIILSTQKVPKSRNAQVQYVYWNPEQLYLDSDFTADNCNIINLAGASVAGKRWSIARKKEIVESRTMSLRTLHQAVVSKQIQARQLVSASAIGYFASQDKLLNENDEADDSFLSQTCFLWEQEALKFRALQIPTAIVRVGIVLSKEGGALKEFLNPLRWGVAAIPGSGSQMMSWVHIEDICRLILHVMDTESNDIYNAVADIPVSTNALFDALLKIKSGIKVHIPEYLLKIVLGEMSTEILKSSEVNNAKIRSTGFTFHYPNIESALENLLS